LPKLKKILLIKIKGKMLNSLIDLSISRLIKHEPPEGYYLAFSGGKDSIVLKKLADLAGVSYIAHYNNTTLDPPELIHFIRKFHPDVQEHRPELSFLKLIPTRGLPRRQARWCCEVLKERGGIGRIVLTGIRWQESPARKQREIFEPGKKGKSKFFLHPIIDWDSSEIWNFIKLYNLPYCRLYDEGYSRIGCILCPMQYYKQIAKEMLRYPKQTNNIRKAVIKLYENRKNEKNPSVKHWKSGEEMFDWWVSGLSVRNWLGLKRQRKLEI